MKNEFESTLSLLQEVSSEKIKLDDRLFLIREKNLINDLIKESKIFDFINSKIKIDKNYDFENGIDDVLLKNLINYFHDDGNIYNSYDIEVFHSNKNLDKEILFYFKIIEIMVSYFTKHNGRTILIFYKYWQFINSLIEIFRLKVYMHLGYEEIPPYCIWDYKKQIMTEIKSKKINSTYKQTLEFLNSYDFKKQTLKRKSIDKINKYYTLWWESYKEYANQHFPEIANKLEYYNGVRIEIYICKFVKMDEKRFGTSDLALCVGMSKNIETGLQINLDENINQIIFLNDVYKDINDVIVTVAYNLNDMDNIKTMVNSEIPDRINSSIVNYYKENINYSSFVEFSENIFNEIGHIVLNKTNLLVIKDYITNKETYYDIEYSQHTSIEVVQDLRIRKKRENNLLIINKDILNSNMKKKFINDNIYIKDIDDMFEIFQKLKNKNNYIQNFIYPYLKKEVGVFENTNTTISKLLIEKLKTCPLGLEGWKQFEEIVFQILNFCFKDSFRKLLIKPQSRNLNGTDIKDYIISNNGKHDFWKDVKQIYNSNNIVIECKNYTNEIGLEELRQVSDYLNKDTYGQFSIIFSRKGLDDNGKKKQNEYLLLSPKKLILVLNEYDIIDMIRAKGMGEFSEEILEFIKFEVETQS